MSENVFRDNLKKGSAGIYRQVKEFKWSFVALTILGLLSAVFNGLIPFVTGRFFDSLITINQDTSEEIPLWVAVLVLWALIQFCVHNVDWLKDRINRFTDSKIHFNIQASGYARLLQLPLDFHKNEHIQGVVQRVSTAAWRVSAILRICANILPQFLSILIGLILILSINYQLALMLSLGVFLYVMLLVVIVPPAAAIDDRAHTRWQEAYDDSVSAITQIESVKNFSTEDYEKERITDSFLEKTYAPWKKLESIWSNISFFQSIIIFITQLSIFIFSVSLIQEGVITVGELIAVNGYSAMFFGPFVSLGYSWQTLQNGLTSASHLEDVLREAPEDYNEDGIIRDIVGDITFHDVSFDYDNHSKVLKNINLDISSGESVALVGKSGSGKSTLVSLISKYYTANSGAVTIDGVDIRDYNLRALRRQIGIVPQEVALFNDTIENNIRYGNFDATHEQVQKVSRDAQLEEFIEDQNDGYQTIIGERGVKLSVGQKQRLAIARAMLRDPKILILDEPTSALDSITEKFVSEAIQKLMKDRTTIIIAHRLSTVRKADKIVVFEGGKIVEIGTHEELIKHRGEGYYKELHDFQNDAS